MSKVKKRIKPTKEQAQELNRRLDAVVKAGHISNLYCDCEVCQALAEQAELMGYRTNSTIKQPDAVWDKRRREYERRHQIDAIKVASLAGQGLTTAEICKKMNHCKAYITKLAKEFNIKTHAKKRGRKSCH